MSVNGVDHEAKVAAAAKLAGEGLDQRAIGDSLHISQATVSRLLRQAEKKGWLVRTAIYREEEVPRRVRDLAREKTEFGDLCERLRQHCRQDLPLRSVRVFDSDWRDVHDDTLPTSSKKEEMDRRLRIFGRAASTRILQLLQHVQVAGISWGATLFHAIHGLEENCGDSPRKRQPVDFVPLCCEPLGNSSLEVSSTQLVARLNAVVNGGKGRVRSFTGVPAFIPKGFSLPERKTVEKLIRYVEDYAEVFPPRYLKLPKKETEQEFMCDRLQLVLTSLAPAERLLGLSEDKLMGAGFDRTALGAVAVGDLCGTVLKKDPGEDEKQNRALEQGFKLIDTCNDSWTGIHLDQLKKVPGKTKDDHDGGIVVVAIGRSKVPVTIKAVREGIHELLIDGDLAKGLYEAINVAP